MRILKHIEFAPIFTEEINDYPLAEKKEIAVILFNKNKKEIFHCIYIADEKLLYILDKREIGSVFEIKNISNKKIVVNNKEVYNYLKSVGSHRRGTMSYFDSKQVSDDENSLARLHDTTVLVKELLKKSLPFNEDMFTNYFFDKELSDIIQVIEMALYKENSLRAIDNPESLPRHKLIK